MLPAVSEADAYGNVLQRWLIIVAVVAVQIAVVTRAADPVNVGKLTVLLVLVIAVLVVAVVRVGAERTVSLPRGGAAYAAAAFGIAAVIATAVAPATGVALWGDYLRNAGLFLYLAGLVLFVEVARVSTEGFLRRLAFFLVGTGGLLAFYTVLQHSNVDPLPWQQTYTDPVSTFGNPDFAGACYSMLLPFAVWGAVWSNVTIRWRLACGVAAGLLLLGDVWSGAAQGFVGAAAALFVLVLGWVLTQRAEWRRRGVMVWLGVAVLGVTGLSMGMGGVGPFAGLGGTGALSIRRHFWDVGLTMFGHHPIVGVGMSMFGGYFRAYRSAGVVHALGWVDAPDEPHDVPLAMFTNGGLVLGLSYLVFVLAVGIALVRALRRAEDSSVMLTAAYGGAWLAFQVQSMVSVDVVPLATLHFVFAGAIVSRAGYRWWSRPLGTTQRRRGPGGATDWPAPPLLLAGLGVVAGLILAWFAIQPLRADIHSSDAAKASSAPQALADLKKATGEASWQGVYWLQRSKADGAVGDVQQGLADLRHALAVNPRDVNAAASLARVEVALKDYPSAVRYFRIAVRLDPRNPDYRTALRDAVGNVSS